MSTSIHANIFVSPEAVANVGACSSDSWPVWVKFGDLVLHLPAGVTPDQAQAIADAINAALGKSALPVAQAA
jgi:hypothetical protein